jgi:hypothetical protein
VQQGPPAAPQTLHVTVLLSQAAFASLHRVGMAVVLLQQGSPMPPQALHP